MHIFLQVLSKLVKWIYFDGKLCKGNKLIKTKVLIFSRMEPLEVYCQKLFPLRSAHCKTLVRVLGDPLVRTRVGEVPGLSYKPGVESSG